MILCSIYELSEFNHCHNPSGAGGGQFCGDRDAFVPPPRKDPRAALSEPYGPVVGAKLRAAQQELLTRFGRDGNEHMVVAHADGSMEYLTSGEAQAVASPRDSFADELRANPPLFTAHTHPTATAPSLTDIRMQVATRTSKQVILGGDGSWFELTVTDFAKAEAALSKGRQYATYWEAAKKGQFRSTFDRLKKVASTRAAAKTDAWIAQQTGWALSVNDAGEKGFRSPDGRWQPKTAIGKNGLKQLSGAAVLKYHNVRFADETPGIWLQVAEKHKDWLTFRYHKPTGPYATTH